MSVIKAEAVPDGHVVEVTVLAPDGEALAGSSTLVLVPENREPPVTTLLELMVPVVLPTEGRYVVRFSGAVEPHEIDFYVRSHHR